MLTTLFVCLALAQPATDHSRLLPFDPIALAQGHETPGDPALSATHNLYTYHFASQSNLDIFLADPDLHAIQFNGACARMGPLSAPSNARRFAVHDNRIYLFASESCRETFLKHADDLLDTDDRTPLPVQCEDVRGHELLALATTWIGGQSALDSITTYTERQAIPYVSANETMDHHTTLALEFTPEGQLTRAYRQDDWHHYGAWGESLTPDNAWQHARQRENGPTTNTALVPSQRRALERTLARSLVVALRAAHLPDALLYRASNSTIPGPTDSDPPIAVENLSIHHNGVTTTLSIDPATGQIHAVTFRAHGGPHSMLGRRTYRFTQYTTIAGLQLPTAAAALFNDQPDLSADIPSLDIEINNPLDPAWFETP